MTPFFCRLPFLNSHTGGPKILIVEIHGFFWAFVASVDVQRLNNRAKRILMSRPWLDINRIRDESLEDVEECSTYNTAMWSTVAPAPLGYHSLRDRFVRRHTNKFRCRIAIPQNFHSANSATCCRCVLLFRQLLFGDCILSNELNENDSTIYSLRMRAHRMSCSSLHRCFANPSRKFARPFRCSKNTWKWPRAWMAFNRIHKTRIIIPDCNWYLP